MLRHSEEQGLAAEASVPSARCEDRKVQEMVLLGKAGPSLPGEKLVLVVSLAARPPWVRLTQEQIPLLGHGFVWGVVDSGNGYVLSLHRSKKAATREANWYNKTDHAITAQL